MLNNALLDLQQVIHAVNAIAMKDEFAALQFKRLESLIKLAIDNDAVNAFVKESWQNELLLAAEDYKIQYNKNGHSYVEIETPMLITTIGHKCDTCRQPLETVPGYLIYVISELLCKDCFESWSAKAIAYQEDLINQSRNEKYFYDNYLSPTVK